MEVLGQGAWLEDVHQRALRVYSHILRLCSHRLFLPLPFSCPPCSALLQPVPKKTETESFRLQLLYLLTHHHYKTKYHGTLLQDRKAADTQGP